MAGSLLHKFIGTGKFMVKFGVIRKYFEYRSADGKLYVFAEYI